MQRRILSSGLASKRNRTAPSESLKSSFIFRFLVLVVSAGTLVLHCAPATALPDVHTVAQSVDAHYNRLRSLQANFTEIYQGNGISRAESGILLLKKPGKMRWEYRSPEEKLFISDGKDAWLYLPNERQARKSSLKKLEDLRSPLAFLLGKTKLEKELTGLSFAPDAKVWHEGNSILRGVPRTMEDQIQQVLIEVTPDSKIARILIDGTDGSLTEYRLSDQKEDVAFSDNSFRFSPPVGTEVEDLNAP